MSKTQRVRINCHGGTGRVGVQMLVGDAGVGAFGALQSVVQATHPRSLVPL